MIKSATNKSIITFIAIIIIVVALKKLIKANIDWQV